MVKGRRVGVDAELAESKRSGWQWVVGVLAALSALAGLERLERLLVNPVDVVDEGGPLLLLVGGADAALTLGLPLVVAWLATRRDAPRAPIGLAMAATLAGVALVASLGEAVAELADPGPRPGAFGVPLLEAPLLGAVIPLVMLLAAVHAGRVRDDPRRLALARWPKVVAAAIVVWTLVSAAPVLGSMPTTQQPSVPLAASGVGALVGLAGLGVIAWFVGRSHTVLVVPAAVVVTVTAMVVSLANAAAVLADAVPRTEAARAIPFALGGPAVAGQLAAAALLTAATTRLAVAARAAWRQRPVR